MTHKIVKETLECATPFTDREITRYETRNIRVTLPVEEWIEVVGSRQTYMSLDQTISCLVRARLYDFRTFKDSYRYPKTRVKRWWRKIG